MTTHPSDQARIARWDRMVLLTLNASRTNYGLAPVTELPKPRHLSVVRDSEDQA